MSRNGTVSYERWQHPIPPLVAATVEAARALNFELCVRPEIGRLLSVLAGGLPAGAIVGETGTGTGTGLAWMISAAPPDTQFISYEIDNDRAHAAQRLLVGNPNIEIVHADASELFDRGPFDLLVHDGHPGSGKHSPNDRVDPQRVLKAGGTMTVDDYTPITHWPPTFGDQIDAGRVAIVNDAGLYVSEINVASDLSVLVARRLPPDARLVS